MSSELKNTTLLTLINAYSSGLKGLINAIAPYVHHNYVFVKFNPVVKMAKYVPIPYLKNYLGSPDTLIDLNGKPENVTVYPLEVFYYPTQSQFKSLGEKQFRAAENMLIQNQITCNLTHAHFTWPQGHTAAKLKEKYGIPFVVTAHGYDIYQLPFMDDEWKEKITGVLNAADSVITVSGTNVLCLKKLGITTPMTVLPNGYDITQFHPMDRNEARKILNLPLNKKIILSVGNLEDVKGHTFLLSVMGSIIKERDDVLCIIVGGGRRRGFLEKQIRQNNLENVVLLAGTVPHQKIPLWMNACDIFVLTSLSEGNPMVMFEALGCGKPFIATRVGGIPDIIVSEEYGFLMEPQNVADIKEKILKSLEKNWNSERIALYAQQFTWQRIAQRTLSIYSSILP